MELEWVAVMIFCRRLHHEPVTGSDPLATTRGGVSLLGGYFSAGLGRCPGDGSTAQPNEDGEIVGCPAPGRLIILNTVCNILCAVPRASRNSALDRACGGKCEVLEVGGADTSQCTC